ncbi:hypothetical protein RCIROH_92 [Rhodobacter phage RcIroh]|nr:hypothetical protein RCIROH_92 [Rhodobacter phage RcIroh]
MERLPKLTEEQISELREFAAVEGRNWKAILEKESWWRGLPCRDKNGKEYSLYNLRNSHGPTWLANFRFPKGSGK